MRLRFLLVLLLFPAALPAQNTRITATTDKSIVATGESFRITVVITNVNVLRGVERAHVEVKFNRGGLFFDPAVPPGWRCVDMPAAPFLSCVGPGVAPAGTQTISVTAMAPMLWPDEPIHATAGHWYYDDANAKDHHDSARVPVEVRPHPSVVDLSVTVTGPALVREGQTALVRFDVRNAGPADASRVIVAIDNWRGDDFDVEEHDWSCVSKRGSLVCLRDSLPAATTAPLTLRIRTREEAGTTLINIRTVAAQSHDPAPFDNFASHGLAVGNAEDYERILIPITSGEHAGLFGSRWHAELRMLIDSATAIKTFPVRCGYEWPPFPPPVRAQIDPFDVYSLVCRTTSPDEAGAFVALRREDAGKARFHLRVRDLARESSLGTEIPVVREHELHTGRILLMSLPLDSAYRHNVRIYDADNRSGAQVVIRIQAVGEKGPRVLATRAFRAGRTASVTPVQLPAFPASIEFDPIREFAAKLQGAKECSIEIEPATPHLRIWAFATITNNATGEVTIVTPQ